MRTVSLLILLAGLSGCSADMQTGVSQNELPIAECGTEDGVIDVGDGCNSCTCENGAWSCTDMACDDDSCTEPPPHDEEDPCFSCSCVGAEWECEATYCGPVCPDPRFDSETDGDCASGVVVAQDPESGLCCTYSNACVAPEGWQTYPDEAACHDTSEPTCYDGKTKFVDCNMCVCDGGTWACSQRECA